MHWLTRSTPLLLALTSTTFAVDPSPATEPAAAPAPAAVAPAADFAPLAHIESRGVGPIQMILIPSAGCDWTVWDTFMTRNIEKYTMHAVTLPGFSGGKAPADMALETIEKGTWIANAETAILQLIEDKKLEKPVIMGHQFGGHLALRLAAKHGEKLRSVINIEGWPAYPLGNLGQAMTQSERMDMVLKQFEPWFKEMTPQMWSDQQRQMSSSFTHKPARSAQLGEMMSKQSKDVLGRYILEYSAADITGMLADIKCPVVAIMCVPDDITDETVREALRTAQLDAFRNAAQTDVVYFEGPRSFVMDDTPIPLDINVDAFLNSKPMPGVKMRPRAPAANPHATPATQPKPQPAGETTPAVPPASAPANP